MNQEKIEMYSRVNRPGRHELTEDDILDIQSEFFVDVSEEVIRKAFAPSKLVSVGDQQAVLHLGRQWGWNDTEVRDSFADLIVKTKAAPETIFG